MYEKILVPLDGSEFAEHVLPHVQALAEKFGSTVTLLRAMLSPEEVLPAIGTGLPLGDPAAYGRLMSPGTIEDYDALLESEKSESETYLNAVAERLKGAGLNVETIRLDGRAADIIVDQAAKMGAGLVTMTTHGRSGLARALVGSVADEVVRKSACPVLLVRVDEKELKTD